jgi:hypothetical protein
VSSKHTSLRLLTSFLAAIIVLTGCSSSSSTSPQNTGSTATSNTTPNAVTIYPGTASIAVSQTVQFKAFLPSAPTGNFTWSVSGSSNGSISSNGLYTAPSSVPSPSTVTITATSSTSSSLLGTATINIAAAQGVQLSPAAVAIAAGSTQSFGATSSGSAVNAQWEVNGTLGGDNIHGTIDSNGNYTAPLTPPPGGATTITAINNNSSGTASVTVFYSALSLNGPYAFSYTGTDGSGFLAVAGSFKAQGSAGTITNGVENTVSFDSNASTSPTQFTGSFTVNPDGSAAVSLSNSVKLQLTLVSNQLGRPVQQAPLIRFDTGATGSGTINAQTTSLFTSSALSGNYVFGASGLDPHGTPIAIAGRLSADSQGNIPLNAAEEDINYGGTNTESAADISLQGSFALDPTYGTTNGLGTLTFTSTDSTILVNTTTTFKFAFYLVDNTHLKLIEIDSNFRMAGDVYSGANTSPIGSFTAAKSIPAGAYAFTMGGVANNTDPYAVGGAVLVNSTSSSVSGFGDLNSGGNVQSDAQVTSGITTDTGFGRLTMSLSFTGTGTLGTSHNTLNVMGYRGAYTTPTGQQGEVIELIELDGNEVALGAAYPQSSSNVLSGEYTFNLSGISDVKSNPVEQDVVGQITASNSALAGALNVNNFSKGATASAAPLTSGTTLVSPDSNGRGTMTLDTTASNAGTFSIVYYNSDDGILLFDADGGRVAVGIMNKQF